MSRRAVAFYEVVVLAVWAALVVAATGPLPFAIAALWGVAAGGLCAQRYERRKLRSLSPASPAVNRFGCSAFGARWCPTCGWCTCAETRKARQTAAGEEAARRLLLRHEDMDDGDCPLHGLGGFHPYGSAEVAERYTAEPPAVAPFGVEF